MFFCMSPTEKDYRDRRKSWAEIHAGAPPRKEFGFEYLPRDERVVRDLIRALRVNFIPENSFNSNQIPIDEVLKHPTFHAMAGAYSLGVDYVHFGGLNVHQHHIAVFPYYNFFFMRTDKFRKPQDFKAFRANCQGLRPVRSRSDLYFP